MIGILIRNESSYNILSSLHNEVFGRELNSDSFLKKKQDSEVIGLVCSVNGKDVAFAIILLKNDNSSCHMWVGGVIPLFQGNKICMMLIDYAIMESERKGLSKLTVNTYHHHIHALTHFIKRGFYITDLSEGKYGDKIKIKLEFNILPPMELRISLTNNCNFKCLFCHNEGYPKGNNGFMEYSILSDLLSEAIHNNCKKITFTGGEPLLNSKALIFAVKYCNSFYIKPDITIVSNCTQLTEELLDKLMTYNGKLEINYSLHSFDVECLNTITGITSCAGSIARTMKLFSQKGVNYRLNYVLLRGISDTVEAICDYIGKASEYNVRKINFLELLGNDINDIQNYYIPYNEMKTLIETAALRLGDILIEFENEKKIRYSITINGQAITIDIFRLTCRSGCENCIKNKDRFISWDGKYYPCFHEMDIYSDDVRYHMKKTFLWGNEIIRKKVRGNRVLNF